jgi:hypothetical protein
LYQSVRYELNKKLTTLRKSALLLQKINEANRQGQEVKENDRRASADGLKEARLKLTSEREQ